MGIIKRKRKQNTFSERFFLEMKKASKIVPIFIL